MTEEITKICNLSKKSDDSHKAEELQVANKFIKYYNKVYTTDYILSKKQPEKDDNPVDVLACSELNSKKELRMQITTFDSKFRENISKNNEREFLRIINPDESHPITKNLADDKHLRFEPSVKKELIFLLDGFWGFNVEDETIQELKDFFRNKGFKEVWIVYSETNCKNLFNGDV